MKLLSNRVHDRVQLQHFLIYMLMPFPPRDTGMSSILLINGGETEVCRLSGMKRFDTCCAVSQRHTYVTTWVSLSRVAFYFQTAFGSEELDQLNHELVDAPRTLKKSNKYV